MLHTQLNDAVRAELQALRRTALPPRVRDRLEIVLLSDADWSPPRIARHLGCYPQTVRNLLHAFRRHGSAALWPRPTGPAPNVTRSERILGLLRDLLGQDRTWTSAQLAEALRPDGIALSGRQVRRYLRRLNAGYRRTASTLDHKQDPAKVERAKQVLSHLKDKAQADQLDLYYLDESGFAPSLPTGYSWALPGERKRVPYEYPQGRRVNVLASYAPYGPTPWLDALPFERTLTSDDLLAYLKGLPAATVPRVVVLDNASMHTSKVFKAQRRALSRQGIYLYYLPPYSPELKEIEAVFKQIKHHEISRRSHTTKTGLRETVEQGFSTYRVKLRPKRCKELRPAA
jgi:putative transposase